MPITIPVANISGSFQLSGVGDGFTLSLDMVIMVPNSNLNNYEFKSYISLYHIWSTFLSILFCKNFPLSYRCDKVKLSVKELLLFTQMMKNIYIPRFYTLFILILKLKLYTFAKFTLLNEPKI